MIIGLSGYAQSGKDSIGQVLVDEHGYTRFAFADILRSVLYALDPFATQLCGEPVSLKDLVDSIGWDQAKKITEVRRLLQAMGTEAGRSLLGQDVWVNALFNQIQGLENVVITDVRFPNEAQRVKTEGGFVVRVTRPGVKALNDHPSEVSLDDWGYDLRIPNDGYLSDLKSLVRDGLQKLQLMADTFSYPSVRLPGYGAPVAKGVT